MCLDRSIYTISRNVYASNLSWKSIDCSWLARKVVHINSPRSPQTPCALIEVFMECVQCAVHTCSPCPANSFEFKRFSMVFNCCNASIHFKLTSTTDRRARDMLCAQHGSGSSGQVKCDHFSPSETLWSVDCGWKKSPWISCLLQIIHVDCLSALWRAQVESEGTKWSQIKHVLIAARHLTQISFFP